jgi:transcriptional regulator with XRE-family HTH domain
MGAVPGLARRFGANLLQIRKQADMSQEEVGLRASLHRTEIGLLERGERMPRIDTVVKLAGALAVSPGALLEGIAWEPGRRELGSFELTFASIPPLDSLGDE